MARSIPLLPPKSLALALFLLLALTAVAACKPFPPREPGIFLAPDLVEATRLEPGLRLDIRYATANNFTGRPLYAQARAFLQRPAAEALARAHRRLRSLGYGILVYDAYRPWSVTQVLWDSATLEQRRLGFVADPKTGSRHNRGCAVDVGLYDLRTDSEVPMPSGYDEFSERAYPGYAGGASAARRARDALRRAMEAEGFQVAANEWWHFDYRDWRSYRLLDVRFEELP
jgi:D-alanyl-D-alanine dipeptidase